MIENKEISNLYTLNNLTLENLNDLEFEMIIKLHNEFFNDMFLLEILGADLEIIEKLNW